MYTYRLLEEEERGELGGGGIIDAEEMTDTRDIYSGIAANLKKFTVRKNVRTYS